MGRDRRSQASSSSKNKSDRDDRKSESNGRRDKRRSGDRWSDEHAENRRTSWDHDGERADGKRRERSSKRISRSRTMDEFGTEGSPTGAGDDGSGSGEMSIGMQASGQFSAQIGAPGFNPFPGQNDPEAGRPPNAEHGPPGPSTSAHVQDQFPGQDPEAYNAPYSAPYRPPISANEGGPGLAAEYYGDQGESVAAQPGVRPQGPSVIMGEQTHLVAASSVPAPPVETGSGSAQDYFVGDGHPQGDQSDEHGPHSRPPRPSKPAKHNTSSGIATASAGAALGYAASHGDTAGSQASILANASQTEHVSIHGQMSSAPEVPTLGNMTGKPHGKHHHSNAGMYAAGAAGLAAGAYALGHSGQHSKPSSGSQLPTYSEANGPHSSHPNNQGYMNAMAMRETDKGPLRKFVDWWKDYEDVRKMEEYTEYIGVCRDCFDPGTSAIDAPRKHHYHSRRRRRRSHGHRPSRVDKGSRYNSSSSSSSSDSESGGNAAAWIGTAAAGYGLAKLGKAFFKGSDSDSDHKHGRKYGGKSHRQHGEGQLPYSGSVRRNTSLNGHGSSAAHTVTRRRSRSQDFGSGRVTVNTKQQKVIHRRRSSSFSSSASRSRSNSSNGRSALVGAGVGVAAGAAAASYLGSSSRRKGSRSPEAVLVRKRFENTGGRASSSSAIHVDGSGAHRGSRHPGSSLYDTTHSAPRHDHDHVGNSSAVVVKRRRSKRRPKSKGGFSFFGNASSSSLSEDGLAFGPGLSRKRSTKRKTSDEKLNAALLGLGATAGALAVAQGKGAKHKTKSLNIYIGAQGRREHNMKPNFDREEGWESASDDDGSISTASSCSSSAESALAFGGAVYGSKSSAAHKSQESLASDSSGTGKWGWRWGSKKRSKKRIDKGSVMATAAAAAAVGAAMNSTTSLPSVQHVHPVQTSDPTRFEASRRNPSVSSVQTPLVMASRPEPTSVQPQPVKPVSNTLFTTEASAYQPGYTVTSGSPHEQFPPFENPYPSQQIPGPGHVHHSSTFSAGQSRDYVITADRPEAVRRRSSPTSISAARDTILAGVGAGTVVSVLSNGKKKDRSSSAGVRFHGVKGDKDQIERTDEESDSRRERRRQRNEARQERLRLEEERERLRQLRRDETAKIKEERHGDMEVTDRKMVKPDDSHALITASVVGVAGAAAANAVIPAGDTQTEMIRTVEVVPDQNTGFDEDRKSAIFDPDYFKNRYKLKHQTQMQRRPSADEIVADLEKRYQEEPQSMATFFAPPELIGQSDEMSSHVSSVIVPGSDGDTSVQAFNAPTIVTIEPPEGMQPPSSMFFNVSKGNIDLNRIAPPWGVPRLNLIEPTPPASRANSVFSASSGPGSPASFSDESVKKEDGDEQQQQHHQSMSDTAQDDSRHDVAAPTSGGDSVTWGNSQTMVLEKESGVDADAHDVQTLSRNFSEKPMHEFKDAILGEEVEEVIGNTHAVKDEEIIRSTSPEVEPIVFEPVDDEDKGSNKIPAAVVFEAISGFGPEDVLEEHSGKGEGAGFVEGEIDEESVRKIPGGFDEDENQVSKPVDKVETVVEAARINDYKDEESRPAEEIDNDDFPESNFSKKQTKKQKKKDKAAKRHSKGTGDDTSDRRDVSRDVILEPDNVTVRNEEDEGHAQSNADPPNEIEPLPAKKSKKAKNRKNAQKDASADFEVAEPERSTSPPVISATVTDTMSNGNKAEDNSAANKPEDERNETALAADAEKINDDGAHDFDNDPWENSTMSKKKAKKNKKGKGAKAAKDDDWTEPNADIEPNTVEVAEPAASNDLNDTFAFLPTSKKDKKKAKRNSKWASVISAVGGGAVVKAMDDISVDGKRSLNNSQEKKVNGDAGLSDALDQEEKDAFYDSRDGPQAELEMNEGTGTRRRDDDDKTEYNRNRNSMDKVIAEDIRGDGQRFLGDRAVKEGGASLPGESIVSSRSITKDAVQSPSNLPGSSQLLDKDFCNTLRGLPDPQHSPPIGSGSGSDSLKSLGNLTTDLPDSPEQGPTTPVDKSHDNQPLSLKESRANSTTSIPLRFRNPNVSPGTPRNISFSSPVTQSAGSPAATPSRPRQQKAHSVDYRSTSALPLYLVERNRQIPPIEESLPSLPSSRTTSRSNSTYGSGDDDFESVREYPRSLSAGSSPMSVAVAMTSAPLSRTSSFFGQAETDYDAELLGSQQATPKASTFPQGTQDLPEVFPDLDLNASGSGEVRSKEVESVESDEKLFTSPRDVLADLSLAPVSTGPKSFGNDNLSSPMEVEPLNLEDLPKLPDSDPPSPTMSQGSRDWDNEDNRRESVITVIGGNAADELRKNFGQEDIEDKEDTRTTDLSETPFATPMMESSENIQLDSEIDPGYDELRDDHPLAVGTEDTILVPTVEKPVIPLSITDTLDLAADVPRSAEDVNDEIREAADEGGTRNLVAGFGPVIPLKEPPIINEEETAPPTQDVAANESNKQSLETEDVPASLLSRQASRKRSKKDKKGKVTRNIEKPEPFNVLTDVPTLEEASHDPTSAASQEVIDEKSREADGHDRTLDDIDVSAENPVEVSGLSKKQQKKKEKRKGKKDADLEGSKVYSEDVTKQASDVQEYFATEVVKEEPVETPMDIDRTAKETVVQPVIPEEISADGSASFFETKASKKKGKKGKKGQTSIPWDEEVETTTIEHATAESPDIREFSALEENKDEKYDSSINTDFVGKDPVVQPIVSEEVSPGDDGVILETKASKKKGKKGKKGKMPIVWDDEAERLTLEHASPEVPDEQQASILEENEGANADSSIVPNVIGEDAAAQSVVPEQISATDDNNMMSEFKPIKKGSKKGKKGKKDKNVIFSYDDIENPILTDVGEETSNTHRSPTPERGIDEAIEPSAFPETAENVNKSEPMTLQTFEAGDDEFPAPKSSKKNKKKKGKTMVPWDAEDKAILPITDEPVEASSMKSPIANPGPATQIFEEQGKIENIPPDASRDLPETADDFQRPLTAKERKKVKKAKKGSSRIDIIANEITAVDNPESKDNISGEQVAVEESAEPAVKTEVKTAANSQTDDTAQNKSAILREQPEITTADDLRAEDTTQEEPIVLLESAEPFRSTKSAAETSKEPFEVAEDTKAMAPENEDEIAPKSKEADSFDVFPVSRTKGKKGKKGKKSKGQAFDSLEDAPVSTSDIVPDDTRGLPAVDEEIANESEAVKAEAVEDPLFSRKAFRKKEKKGKKPKKGLVALDLGDDAGFEEEAATSKNLAPNNAELTQAAAVSLPDVDVSEEIDLAEAGHEDHDMEPSSQDQSRSLLIAPLELTDTKDVQEVSNISQRDNDVLMKDAAAIPLPSENNVARIDQMPSTDKDVPSLSDNTTTESEVGEARDISLPEMGPTEKEELQKNCDSERDETATPFDAEPRNMATPVMGNSENLASQPENVPLPEALDETDKLKEEQSRGASDLALEEASNPNPSSMPLPVGDDIETADLGLKRIDENSISVLDDAAVIALPVATDDELRSSERSLDTKSTNLALADEAKSIMLPESNLEELHDLNENSYTDQPNDRLVEEAKNVSLPLVDDEELLATHNLSNHDYDNDEMENARHIPLPDTDGEEAATVVQRSEDSLHNITEEARAISLPGADAGEAVKLEDRFGGDRRDEVIENAKDIVLPDPDPDEAVTLQEKAIDDTDLGGEERMVIPSVRDTEETEMLHMPMDGGVERRILDDAREISLPLADDEEMSVLEERDASKDKKSRSEEVPSVPVPPEDQDVLVRSEPSKETDDVTQLVDEAKSIPLPISTPEETITLVDPQQVVRSIPLEDAQVVPLPKENIDELEELEDAPLDEREDGIQSSRIRDVKDAVKAPGDTSLKFAATVAAGLQDSGFDPNIVIADPAFSRRSSPTDPSAALESENISFAVKKGKKAKKGRKKSTEPSTSDTRAIQDHESLDQGRAGDVVHNKPSESYSLGNDEFTADVLAGLRSSGFDPKVLEESSSTTRAPPVAMSEAEPEDVFAVVMKPKKGKKGKKAKASIESTQLDKTEDPKESDVNDKQDGDENRGDIHLDPSQSPSGARGVVKDRSLLDESLNVAKEIALPEPSNDEVSSDKMDKMDSDAPVNDSSRAQPDEANEFTVTKKSKKNKKGKKKSQGLAAAEVIESPSVTVSITGELNSESADAVKSVQGVAEAEGPPQPNLVTEDRKLEDVPASKSPTAQITAPEPTWSFSSVRDSAVVVPDTPIVSQTVTAINTNRDSGYIGSPNGQELVHDFNYQSLSAGAKSAQGIDYGDRYSDAAKVVADDENIPVDIETVEDKVEAQPNMAKESLSVKTNFSEGDDGEGSKVYMNVSPVQLARQISSSPRGTENDDNGKAIASPKSPTPTPDMGAENVTSTAPIGRSKGKKKKKKNKSMYISDDKEVEDYFTQKPTDEDSAPKILQAEASLRNLTATPSATLETIHERGSQVSPVHKTTRSISDVGSPDHGLKSARRTSTPKPNIGERVRYSPASATSSSTNNKRDGEKSQISTEDNLSRLSWPPVDEENDTVELDRSFKVDPSKLTESQHRSPSATSNWSNGSAGKFKSPDFRRPTSAHSNASSTHSLRRTDRSISGDLRAASRLGDSIPRSVGRLSTSPLQDSPLVRPPSYEPLKGRGERRTVVMAEIYEGVGDSRDSPRSPTRPPSVRKRQSLQIIDLEARLDRLSDERRQLQEAAINAEHQAEDAAKQREVDSHSFAEEVASRDQQLRDRQSEIQNLEESFNAVQQEVIRLTEANRSLTELNSNLQSESENRLATLEAERDQAHQQWNETSKLLEQMRQQHHGLSVRMEDVVQQEIRTALDDKNAELDRLREELDAAMEEIRALQEQTLASNQTEDYLNVRDEDYFDSACQQLCQHVQQWVLRFSKFSDHRACRLSTDITDEKIEARLDNAILDGSDVDALLADRVKRRDVFMSVVMTMIWEFVFTRYLFGMEREQRQKLKALEKTLLEIGPARAVAQWRATTLTLLSRHQASFAQREQDTEAVVHEIYDTLATLLPPPSNLRTQIMTSLRNVMSLAVDLSIEMRTQRAEYVMLPPLQPEYDTNGDLARTVHFNASLMNERSGETTSNEELEERQAVVKIVLFPLVVKKGDDLGEGEDEIVVCPAQVLVAKPGPNKKVVRVLSGAMEMTQPAAMMSATSVGPQSTMDMSNVI